MDQTPERSTLSALEMAESAELNVKDLNGDPTNTFITIVNPSSDRLTKVQEDWETKLARYKRRTRNISQADMEIDPVYREMLTDNLLTRLTVATIKWREGDRETLEWKGRFLECTPENIREVYEGLMSLRRQVAEFFTTERNFIKR